MTIFVQMAGEPASVVPREGAETSGVVARAAQRLYRRLDKYHLDSALIRAEFDEDEGGCRMRLSLAREGRALVETRAHEELVSDAVRVVVETALEELTELEEIAGTGAVPRRVLRISPSNGEMGDEELGALQKECSEFFGEDSLPVIEAQKYLCVSATGDYWTDMKSGQEILGEIKDEYDVLVLDRDGLSPREVEFILHQLSSGMERAANGWKLQLVALPVRSPDGTFLRWAFV